MSLEGLRTGNTSSMGVSFGICLGSGVLPVGPTPNTLPRFRRVVLADFVIDSGTAGNAGNAGITGNFAFLSASYPPARDLPNESPALLRNVPAGPTAIFNPNQINRMIIKTETGPKIYKLKSFPSTSGLNAFVGNGMTGSILLGHGIGLPRLSTGGAGLYRTEVIS